MKLLGQYPQCLNQFALFNPLLKTPVAGLIRRVLGRHLGPLRTTAKNPENTVQNRARVVPRAATVVLTPRWAQERIRSTKSMVDERSEADIAYFASFAA